MNADSQQSRRQNTRWAQIIQHAIALQSIAGAVEAKRHLLGVGLPTVIIDRVLSPLGPRRRVDARTNTSVDRRDMQA